MRAFGGVSYKRRNRRFGYGKSAFECFSPDGTETFCFLPGSQRFRGVKLLDFALASSRVEF